MSDPVLLRGFVSAVVGFAGLVVCYWGGPWVLEQLRKQERRYHRSLNERLLLDASPRLAVAFVWASIGVFALFIGLVTGSPWGAAIGAAGGAFLPPMVLRHLEEKRQQRLETQLVDGLTTLASAVRAGLNLVQAMELLVRNGASPLRDEFAQLLKEYQLGQSLDEAMRSAANRIGSRHYRLVFTAIETHRQRGGDTGESLDRIADSIREIQRLEGRLDALTAQGRSQARFMGIMPVVMLGILALIDPGAVELLFTEALGRILLLVAAVLIVVGFLWIRRIMSVDL